jgi:hypothetical protein
MVCAVVALQAPFPIASLAADGGVPVGQQGEDRWVPSLAITGGATIQKQHGFVDSVVFEGMNPNPVPLQGVVEGDDLVVSPFVGASLEVMTPAIPIPTRPRPFLSGEILPTFGSDREIAVQGDPGCIKGPRLTDPCASAIETPLDHTFAEDAANGQGSTTTTLVDTLVFGAKLGVAFPAQLGKRQLRIKPSVGWINYEVGAEGVVVDAACDPVDACTPVQPAGGPPTPGFLRDTTLTANDSGRFNGIGPGLDIEMDVVRYGPLGVSLFLGGGAYRVLGNRKIAFSASEIFTDQISAPGTDRAVADFEAELDPWMYRAHLGIRFEWLGNPE